jgi:small subunit ribosomal protein S20
MANTASAKKATRKIDRRTAINKARRSRIRSSWRKVEEALAAGDGAGAQAALKAAETETMRAVSRGVMHANTGSRKVSRLTQRVKTLTGVKAG